MDSDVARVRAELQESIDRSLADVDVTVVVMGPRLDADSPSARLRRRIVEAAKALGASIKPEHRAFSDTAKQGFGEGYNLTRYEWELVKISHLAILIPDSPGSLCELGLFADASDFGPKLLILANADYEGEQSYVADGPLQAATHNGAEVQHVDYADFEGSWSFVKRRIEIIQARLSMRRVTGGAS